MRVTLADIDRWDPAAITTVFQAAIKRAHGTRGASAALTETMKLLVFGGDTAQAAHAATRHTATMLDAHSDDCEAVGRAAQTSAEEVAGIKTRLQVIRETAHGYHLAIDDQTGAVSLPPNLSLLPGQQDAIFNAAEQLAASIHQLLADAESADEDLAAAIRGADGDLSPAQVNAQLSHQAPRMSPVPTARSNPRQINAWWRALNPRQQNQFEERFPDAIRNLDGIPTDVRNELNMSALYDGITRLHNGWLDAQGSWHTDPEKLADLQALRDTLAAHPGASLILLDTTGNPSKVLAAVGIGEVDTAERVGVTVGGLSTRVSSSVADMVREVEAQRSKAIELRGRAKAPNPAAVAVVAWLGYDAPEGLKSVFHDWRARDGAGPLNNFYRGLAATTQTLDQHITAFGHSYGSLTTSLALQRGAPVSDVVLYGSPGTELTNAAQLGVAPGHAYYLIGVNDDVAEVIPGFGAFGSAPQNVPGMTALSTSTGLALGGAYGDGALHERAFGHAEYEQMGSNGELRMSGYNMAAVLAGLPDDLVLPRAVGLDTLPDGSGPFELPSPLPVHRL